jgi:hypothetical protein
VRQSEWLVQVLCAFAPWMSREATSAAAAKANRSAACAEAIVHRLSNAISTAEISFKLQVDIRSCTLYVTKFSCAAEHASNNQAKA